MDVSNSLDGLRSLLGISPTDAPPARNGAAAAANRASSDQATVSSAGSEVSQSATDDGVRAEKVASIHAALAAGTYNVPASAVASKLVDTMLGGGIALAVPSHNAG